MNLQIEKMNMIIKKIIYNKNKKIIIKRKEGQNFKSQRGITYQIEKLKTLIKELI